jgi:septal ring-binding cell division protein DamX
MARSYEEKGMARSYEKKPMARSYRVLLALLFLFAATPAHADYQAGLDAYNAGDYAAAMTEWKAVARQEPSRDELALYREALYGIAMLHWQGQGVPQDLTVAAVWLKQAADINHPGAQAKLGFLYSMGVGVPQNFAQAERFLRQAVAQGDADARANLQMLADLGLVSASDIPAPPAVQAAPPPAERMASPQTMPGAEQEPDPSVAAADAAPAQPEPAGEPQPGVLVSEAAEPVQETLAEPEAPEEILPEVAAWVIADDATGEMPPVPADANETVDPPAAPQAAEGEIEGGLAAATNPEETPRVEEESLPEAAEMSSNEPAPVEVEEPLPEIAAWVIPEEPPAAEVTAAAEETGVSDQPVPGLDAGEEWIQRQDPEHYTIQVIALSNPDKLHQFIAASPDWTPFALYRQTRYEQPLWVLVQGVYADVVRGRGNRPRGA